MPQTSEGNTSGIPRVTSVTFNINNKANVAQHVA